MGSALHVEYLGVALRGVFVVIKSYQRDGLATIKALTSLLRKHKDKQIHPMKPTWNGFHSITCLTMDIITGCMMNYVLTIVYLLIHSK